jgi:hypothetical protein
MIETLTFRALCWIPPRAGEPRPLTEPEHRHLSSEQLFALGRSRAENFWSAQEGRLEVVPFTGVESLPSYEVVEVRPLLRETGGTTRPGHPMSREDCQRLTDELASGHARIIRTLFGDPRFTHEIELTHNLDDSVLPFTLTFEARLE